MNKSLASIAGLFLTVCFIIFPLPGYASEDALFFAEARASRIDDNASNPSDTFFAVDYFCSAMYSSERNQHGGAVLYSEQLIDDKNS